MDDGTRMEIPGWLTVLGRLRNSPPVAADDLAGRAVPALAHLVGVPPAVLSGLTIAGIDLWPTILVTTVIATTLPESRGGERGIRTLGTRKRTHDFQSCPFNRSGTSPEPARRRC